MKKRETTAQKSKQQNRGKRSSASAWEVVLRVHPGMPPARIVAHNQPNDLVIFFLSIVPRATRCDWLVRSHTEHANPRGAIVGHNGELFTVPFA